MLAQIDATLERFGVRFDSFVHERTLAEKGEIDAADRAAAGRRATSYEAEGAVWFRSTAFGDDKDRPLVRSNGTHTYFGADCAYLVDKFERGFDHLVYVWGADHHGDVARVRGAAEALGYDADRVEIVIYQWVSFLRDGVPVPMSKRAGTFVSLDELIDEVGTDAARFHLLMFSNDVTMNFDIEAVKRQSLENPVYYVQYGHARIASILRKAAERGIELRPIDRTDLARLEHEAELDVLRAARRRAGPDRDGRRAPGAAPAHARRAGPRGALPPLLHGVPGPVRRRRAHAGPPVAVPRHQAGRSRTCSGSSACPRPSRWSAPMRREVRAPCPGRDTDGRATGPVEGVTMSERVLRVGMLGCGTVGAAVVRLLERHRDDIERRAGCRLEVTPGGRPRHLEAPGTSRSPPSAFVDDPMAVVDDPDVDIVCELIGGARARRARWSWPRSNATSRS